MPLIDWLRPSQEPGPPTLPAPPKRKSRYWVLIVIAAVAAFAYVDSRSPEPLPGADMSWDGLQFHVTNTSTASWANIKLEVNSGAYTARVDHIARGGTDIQN